MSGSISMENQACGVGIRRQGQAVVKTIKSIVSAADESRFAGVVPGRLSAEAAILNSCNYSARAGNYPQLVTVTVQMCSS